MPGLIDISVSSDSTSGDRLPITKARDSEVFAPIAFDEAGRINPEVQHLLSGNESERLKRWTGMYQIIIPDMIDVNEETGTQHPFKYKYITSRDPSAIPEDVPPIFCSTTKDKTVSQAPTLLNCSKSKSTCPNPLPNIEDLVSQTDDLTEVGTDKTGPPVWSQNEQQVRDHCIRG